MAVGVNNTEVLPIHRATVEREAEIVRESQALGAISNART